MNDTLDSALGPNFKTNIEANYESNCEMNFNTAMKLSAQNYTYDELINFLRSGNIAEKQIAALELNEIKSKEDAQILVSNLVGQDGKIREAVAYKLNEFALNPNISKFFINDNIFELFLKGLMDINGNVCRQIADNWGKNRDFQMYLCNKLPERISVILEEIAKLDKNAKQYKISKRNFQLYWSLEALSNIVGLVDFENIKSILKKTGDFEDYTIREKTAKILAKVDNSELAELKEKLKNDENYYVRRYLSDTKLQSMHD